MLEPLQVRISRDGKEIGTYPAAEVVRLRTNGTLKETDFYWCEGMADWAPLTEFLAAEARRQLAEKVLLKKQEDARRAERLAQEKAKAKEEEDRVVAEAVRVRMEKEKANHFRCHCCRESFRQPRGLGDMIGSGIGAILLGAFIGVLAMAGMASGGSMAPAILLFLSSIASLFGLCIVIAAFVRSPHCPNCESTNFSRPEKPDEQK